MEEKSKETQSIEELIYTETENRLSIMERPNYEFPPKASKIDAVAIVAGIVVCLFLICLCAVGVIQ